MIQECAQGLRYGNRTIIGQILVLKSLFISKYVYKFTHYPRPTDQCLKRFNKELFDFVWQESRHKLNQTDMYKPLEQGGFNMIDIVTQQFCLQLRWIVRTLHNANNKQFWEHYLQVNLKIKLCDFLRCNYKTNNFKNLISNWNTFPSFWKQLFREWFRRTGISRKEGWIPSAWKKGILFNPMFARVRYKESLVAYEMLVQLDVFSIEEIAAKWKSIPETVKQCIRNSFIKCRSLNNLVANCIRANGQVIAVQDLATCIVKSTPSCKKLYTVIKEKDFTTPLKKIQKWERDLDASLQDDWSGICRKTTLIFNTKLRSFHILFLNRSYQYNYVMSKYKDISSKCSFCDEEDETICHLFWECSVVQPVWAKIIEFCNEYICTRDDVMNKVTCMLSIFSDSLLVLIVTLFKKHIHMCRHFGHKVHIKSFLLHLKATRNRDELRAGFTKNLRSSGKYW